MSQIKTKPGWPRPMADVVYSKIRNWLRGYELGKVYKPKAVAHPRYGEDSPIIIAAGYEHQIPFRLNELFWLEQLLEYVTQGLPNDDPKKVIFGIIRRAREQHEKLQDQKRIGVGSEYGQSYAFDKTHIQWLYSILGQHMIGRLTSAAELKQVTSEIEQADW